MKIKYIENKYTVYLSKRGLWLLWVFANTIGAGLGAQIAGFAGAKNANDYQDLLIFGLFTVVCVGIAQALVLHHQLAAQRRNILSLGWVILSSFSSFTLIALAPPIMVVVFLLASLLPLDRFISLSFHEIYLLQFLFFGLVSGAIAGTFQHILFPNFQGNRARQWIVFSSIGAGLSLSFATLIVSHLFPNRILSFYNVTNELPTLGMGGMTIFNLISGAINGGITGIQIVRIFRFNNLSFKIN